MPLLYSQFGNLGKEGSMGWVTAVAHNGTVQRVLAHPSQLFGVCGRSGLLPLKPFHRRVWIGENFGINA
jgi:hypothetical protein